MSKLFLLSGSVLAAVAVAIGAFGAHALKELLTASNKLETFETAVRYQFYHALALLFLGLIMLKFDHKMFAWSGYSFIVGTIIFSGSLYILSLTGVNKWGAVTPLGGVALLIGWITLIIGLSKSVN